MSKSLKDANWGSGGILLILFSIGIFIIYLVTGGFYNRQGKFFKLSLECAAAGSGLFFLLGSISIAASLALRARKRSRPSENSRWRRRVR